MTNEAVGPRSSDSVIRTLSAEECYELLAVATVGRIGFVSPAGIEIIPVNYRIAGNRVLFKTAPSSLLAQLAGLDIHVAFEVDYHASDFVIAWSVLMHGVVNTLDAHGEVLLSSLRHPLLAWPGANHTLALQFVPHDISGRSLMRRAE
jgi:nitroimidazol reductase NimA-like FMN-containing flavoprotein (pyridoxamine 5'-phosphate oxidase superfamily)